MPENDGRPPNHRGGENSRVQALRFVFLDRDGVLNRDLGPAYVARWEEFELLPGALEGVARLSQAGLTVIVVSNQRGISTGEVKPEALRDIHRRLADEVERVGGKISAFYVCPHDRDCTTCRKPAIGLYHQARRDFPDITPENSAMIGNSPTDMEFAEVIGMKAILIGDEKVQAGNISRTASSLLEAADFLVSG